MTPNEISRRQFLGRSAALAGSALAATAPLCPAAALPAAAAAEGEKAAKNTKRSATDLVPLGRKKLMICRIGIGTGSSGGDVQRKLGQEGFTKLIRECYDRGITFIDTADMYHTHEMVREAIKGLPREKLWIQTKMMWDRPGVPEKPLEVLDRFRKELGVDYVDSLLVHCATQNTWDADLKPMLDVFDEAQEKKLIRTKGVSCHGLPALKRALDVDWVEVHLARINPQGKRVDGTFGKWDEPGNVPEATKTIKAMHEKGRGILGMKIIGNGEFTDAADREKSVRFAMTCGYVDSIVVGLKSAAEADELIGRMNRALVEA
ncbi:MAG: aldo/keto reductase [Planctomycetes bacterium]|nr:aldo/keto reductase [Planctomycetota bacterium]